MPALRMKAFLLKYKRTIIYWVVFLSILLWLVPMQQEYYLDKDIDNFKTTYFRSFLIWLGVGLSVSVFLVVLFKTKSFKQSGIVFFYSGFYIAIYLFLSQDLFLGAALFVNRLYKKESVQKTYLVSFFSGEENTFNGFWPYDVKTKHINTDQKLKNKLYQPSLKENDTIVITCTKGLLGVEFNAAAYK